MIMFQKTLKARNASLIAITGICLTMTFAGCGKDEEPDGNDNQNSQIVTVDELARDWTLVKDIVLYSLTDPTKSDKVIDYSGNTSPLYRYFSVEKTSDTSMRWQEESALGTSLGTPISMTLKGDVLYTSNNQEIGTIEGFNLTHSWNNLQIRWNEESPLNKYGAPCVSYYMK